MKSLDEQIEYMRKEIKWYDLRVTTTDKFWAESLKMSKAILDTLLLLKLKRPHDR